MLLSEFRHRFQSIALTHSRNVESIRLVAVSKQQSIDKILSLYHQGQVSFAENYLQEAITKIEVLKDYPIEWHFIGRIQRNKTKEIATHFSWVQSLDRTLIAKRLNEQRPIDLPPLQVCIEINDSKGKNKSGISLDELPKLITCLQTLPRLQWRGLMTMITDDYEKVANCFYHYQKKGYNIDTLSMGMSSDYPKAIAAGSNMLRIGQALFGERKQS